MKFFDVLRFCTAFANRKCNPKTVANATATWRNILFELKVFHEKEEVAELSEEDELTEEDELEVHDDDEDDEEETDEMLLMMQQLKSMVE
jgi:hypothetical protein